MVVSADAQLGPVASRLVSTSSVALMTLDICTRWPPRLAIAEWFAPSGRRVLFKLGSVLVLFIICGAQQRVLCCPALCSGN